ncbi:MAG TPA: flavin reductase family protein [Streptomyces sp.]|uniref:flavin reductase family protein n=1 Tax=Streptomyces sp. TaxID=1931 RepID=UPI002D4A45C5|nr:flavin reductase family protein [Streptomyces sp.]HZG03819.1 flavin reductase family protein [Streptomyces sp.]
MSATGTRRAPDVTDAGPALLRAAFRRHAAGVAVITAHGRGRPAGFTATSLASVAAEPPLLSFNVGTASSTWPVIAEAEHVGVHVLGEHQRELAAVFARPGADRFAPPTRWRRGPHGVPVLEDVPAWLVCEVVARVPAGDHRLVLAEAVAGDASGTGRPLLYHAGRFNVLSEGAVPP